MQQNRVIYAKNKEFEITDKDHPFKDDKLGRQQYAVALTDVVEAYNGGAVIALNGAWGTGKTTFLKMWKQHLENTGFPVVYYNAWEDDICEEPLLSMLRELKGLNKEDGLDKVFKTGAKVVVGALAGALSAATGVFGDIAKGATEGGLKQLEDLVCESLKEEDDRTKLMHGFKGCFTDYMTTVCNNGKPLVYMVDELDRCNPTFAVKVLERIKHLFDVPNAVFILSVDKKQLACSVKGFYGSSEIDADEYLRRFIDIEYKLPDADPELFCEYLYDHYGYDKFFRNTMRLCHDYGGKRSEKADEDKNNLLFMAKSLVLCKHLSLRQIERVFSNANIALCSMKINDNVLPHFLLVLSYLKICCSDTFERIANFTMEPQEFVNSMEQVITRDMLNQGYYDFFHYLMSIAISCYYEGYRKYGQQTQRQSVGIYGSDGNLSLAFTNFDYDLISKDMSACRINNDVCDIAYITRKLNLYDQMTYQDDSNFELPKADPASVERLKEIYKIK